MVGTKWFKCDLHLHTPASKCFRDRDTVTPDQWVQAALDKGLQCVAVTDHNTGEWIGRIQEAAKGKDLTVFPGVEITCSDSKVHLLVLFDPERSQQDIEDFILLAGIERSAFGNQDAHASKQVEQIITLANERGAICIPAHIDEFNGLSEVANAPRNILYQGDAILGVQIVHKAFLLPDNFYNSSREDIHKQLNSYYGVDDEQYATGRFKVTEERMKDWRQSVVQAVKCNKAVLTFSDNPHEQGDSRHGLWGIGQRYSWIKMDQAPSLESLRQALLLHKFRIKSDFDCGAGEKPYNDPKVWISKVAVQHTEISHVTERLEVSFSPQMNTIIGGRGSGKSSILQFIRGVFGKADELDKLYTAKEEFRRFFQPKDGNGHGVLKPGCSIEVEVVRNEELFKVTYYQTNKQNKDVKVFQFNLGTGAYEEVDRVYLEFFDVDIFSQKQIYEVATNLSSLRERIDETSETIKDLHNKIAVQAQDYKLKCSEIRTLELRLLEKPRLQAEIRDIEGRIKKYHASGIDNELKRKQQFGADTAALNRFAQEIAQKSADFDQLSKSIQSPSLGPEQISEEYQSTLGPVIAVANGKIAAAVFALGELKESYLKIPTALAEDVRQSQWQSDRSANQAAFDLKIQELSTAGVDALEQIKNDSSLLERKQQELKLLLEMEQSLAEKETEKIALKKTYLSLRKDLTDLRRAYLGDMLRGKDVKANIGWGRDLQHLEEQIRKIIGGSPTAYVNDIEVVKSLWSGPNPVRSNEGLSGYFLRLKNGDSIDGQFSGHFVNKIAGLTGEQMDELALLFPEDEINIEYRNKANIWKKLSNVSAGQKTAAILTMILCQGEKPLILDQPEDDLDNHLIYELVVEQLRKSKECRQIICVTHNANIPVNGDSEHIIVMDSETPYLSNRLNGCIEQPEIKKAICDIMEGGTEAFEMRSKRYRKLSE